MRAFVVCAVVAGVTALGMAAGGCTDLGVGRKCLNPASATSDAGVVGTTISSPSLECMSRLCYLQQGTDTIPDSTYCTARCTSDSDCKSGLTGTTAGLCGSSFVCAVASDVGPFGCQALCICKDNLNNMFNQDPVDGGVICPTTCQQANNCPTINK